MSPASSQFLRLENSAAAPRAELPELATGEWRSAVIGAVRGGWRLAALFGVEAIDDRVTLVAVLADHTHHALELSSTTIAGGRWPALTPELPAAHLFEREIAETWGLVPEGHPWLKPVRFGGVRRGAGLAATVGITDYYRIEGAEVHEVAVGPVHAGVIEPGHFRFQCDGERVLHLEISLGYQHRGIERALVGGPDRRTLHLVETLAGDTTVGHATAFAMVMEALAGVTVPARAELLRGIGLELERLANHTGNLGMLAGDVAFLPTAAWCGRLRGDWLNLAAELCGSRFGRGLVRPGGVGFDLGAERLQAMSERVEAAARDVSSAVGLLWESPSVVARFEDTGKVSSAAAAEAGLVGVAARASGLDRDSRRDLPSGPWRTLPIDVAVAESGDVLARAQVRALEIEHSVGLLRRWLTALPEGPTRVALPALGAERVAVGLSEGFRGEIVHVALTGADGRFAGYKVVDPSFRNWTGLALALRDQQISDFPLCNKSFDLSYCGVDL